MDIKNKLPLNFKNGKFKILAISDLHGTVNYDRRLTENLGIMLDGVNPDLLLVLGDIADHDAIENGENLKKYLDDLNKVFEDRKIPWAHTFGNHDCEDNRTFSQMDIYEKYPYCISKRGPDNIHGVTNYVLPIFDEKNEEILFNVWMMDSHDSLGNMMNEFNLGDPKSKWDLQCCYPTCLHDWSATYNTLNIDQIVWYYNTSVEFERYAGHKIPGLLAQHIPLPEYVIAYKNTAETYYEGIRREGVGCPPVNSGMFNAMLGRGDIKTVVAGHDHINNFTGTFMGIKLTYDAGFSYDCYCHDDLRGGRVFELYENDIDNIKTYMVRFCDMDNKTL